MSKISEARKAFTEWCASIGIHSVAELNSCLQEGRGIDLINLCEAKQERDYAAIADMIKANKDKKRIVMMAGPSSSGKTSSSLRIALQCRVLGLNPKVIELDNYFVDREQTPIGPDGKPDFECLGAMDTELLNRQLNELLEGKTIEVPHFVFTEGRKVYDGNFLKLEENDILMMEGIHGLNPALTPDVDDSKIFHIYISALNALFISDMMYNSPTDKRLLRRILRDNRTRGINPENNILGWDSVRRGEKNNIFPYEENADVVFNSSLLYDLPMLKYYTEPILHGIAESSPAYAKAQQLLQLLGHITALTPAEIAAVPPTSIMREFIGGQTLKK